jgi:flagellar M-ring protein FliF
MAVGGEGGNAVALPAPDEPHVDPAQQRLDEARRIAAENPAAVANILRGWITNGV